jgi:UDP-hydrolysing UDP-N-acetyl-D-glucosamine 2-epimerase
MKKKIDIIVVSRADLYPLLPIINKKSDNISYRIISTGSLLTKNQIESCKDINTKYKKIFISSEKDGEFDIINNISDGIKKFSKFYKNKKPEAILVLGDRFELLVVAIISIIYGIPIAHIHGGEITEGSFDNTIRHCISKVATLHFVSNLIYKKRLIQMGEQPKYIFISGAPGLYHFNTG